MRFDISITIFFRKILFVLIVFFYCFNLSADIGRKLDSLYTILKTSKNDTVKVNAHLKIVGALMKEDTVKGLHEVKKILYSINGLTDKAFAFRSINVMLDFFTKKLKLL